MESLLRSIKTSTGKIIISGPLEHIEDLSFSSLTSILQKEYERGYSFHRFPQQPKDEILNQFKVFANKIMNSLTLQEKYLKIKAREDTNPKLNRYNGIFVCILKIDEKNCVKLPEYINASIVSGPDFPSQRHLYVATQGPLPQTILSFWKMVWTTSAKSIFMLCSPQECQKVRST